MNRHGQVAEHALSPRSVAKILERAASRAGINAASIAGHILRAGMVTQAALNGAEEREIAKTTRVIASEILSPLHLISSTIVLSRVA